jgi:hypothetical protein
MRWKLLALMATIAALVSCGLWSGLAIGCCGSAAGLAHHDWLYLASHAIPIGIAALAAFFVYRHTARRRKTQTFLTMFLTLVLTAITYLIAASIFPERLYLSHINEIRNAR